MTLNDAVCLGDDDDWRALIRNQLEAELRKKVIDTLDYTSSDDGNKEGVQENENDGSCRKYVPRHNRRRLPRRADEQVYQNQQQQQQQPNVYFWRRQSSLDNMNSLSEYNRLKMLDQSKEFLNLTARRDAQPARRMTVAEVESYLG